MRPRILVVLVALLVLVLGALGVPLATSIAAARGQTLAVDRTKDADRFASIAEQGDTDGDLPLLRAELTRYDELYAVAAAVVDTDGRPRVFSRGEGEIARALAGDDARRRVRAALGGRAGQTARPLWPWDDRPLVVAVPMVRGGDVIGAVVTVSPTGRGRAEVLHGWALLGLGGLVALAGGVLLALRTTRWVLRPVHVLDSATHEIATGRLAARVTADAGPPELRRLAQSFNEMAAQVEQVVEQQRAFVADASHQLRNPLNALLLRLTDLEMRLPEPWSPEVAVVTDECRHLARALEALLELARAEHAGAPPQTVDVVRLVDARLAAWQVVAARRGVAVTRSGAATAGGRVDPAALDGALDVVLDNALKFGPENSRVVVDVLDGAGEVVVAVHDEGPGLDAEECARAGDRFWRSRRHQNVDGSGLGLAIARTLLAPSGARLEVAPGSPSGLSVRLRVPAAEVEPRVTA